MLEELNRWIGEHEQIVGETYANFLRTAPVMTRCPISQLATPPSSTDWNEWMAEPILRLHPEPPGTISPIEAIELTLGEVRGARLQENGHLLFTAGIKIKTVKIVPGKWLGACLAALAWHEVHHPLYDYSADDDKRMLDLIARLPTTFAGVWQVLHEIIELSQRLGWDQRAYFCSYHGRDERDVMGAFKQTVNNQHMRLNAESRLPNPHLAIFTKPLWEKQNQWIELRDARWRAVFGALAKRLSYLNT